MVELIRRAAEVLGIDPMARWMKEPVPALGGRTPYSLRESAEGREQVGRVLGQIEHGVY